MRIVFLGLSITSSFGNGHAVTYRGLVRELAALGHDILFLERDAPGLAANRDQPSPQGCRTVLYASLTELVTLHAEEVHEAHVVIVGSKVPEGAAVGQWVTATARGAPCFYDLDTPATLAGLARWDTASITPGLIPRYALYLSFTGGPTLDILEKRYGSPAARVLYGSADVETHYPLRTRQRYDLGHMGTYSQDRQPALDTLLTTPARDLPGRRFVVAGPLYPDSIAWPDNVRRVEHLPPSGHRAFYASQRFTVNVTRADMARAGWSPGIRLFEAAACATPVISDDWEGLDELFTPDEEIIVARHAAEVTACLCDLGEDQRLAMGQAARKRVLAGHTAARRAKEFLGHLAGIGVS